MFPLYPVHSTYCEGAQCFDDLIHGEIQILFKAQL